MNPAGLESTAAGVGDQRWAYRTGGGAKAWKACLPFVILCAACTAIALADPEYFHRKYGEGWYRFALACSILMLAVGILVPLIRKGATIDRTAGTVATWWGVLGCWFKRVQPLEKFRTVELEREARATNNGKFVFQIVTLRGPDRKAELVRTYDYAEARRSAEQVALLTGLRYLDSTDGVARQRQADPLMAEFGR